MAKIAIDIDSTLYDFCGLACRVMGEMAEHSIFESDRKRLRNAAYATSWPEWRTPIDLAGEKMWQEVVDRCHDPETILQQTPYLGASDEIWNLWTSGHEIVYVSNRAPYTEDATAEWLNRHTFPLEDESGCSLLCHTEDKLASIIDCQYLIDDRPRTLVGFVHGTMHNVDEEGHPLAMFGPGISGRKAFGLVTPYNRGLTDVPSIYLAPNWPLLGSYLREKVPSAA